MKKISFILFFLSFSFSVDSTELGQEIFIYNISDYNESNGAIEFSVGINDKTGLFGWFSGSWITDKPYGESYITVGGLGIIGSLGYGQKRYLSRARFFSSYVSWTGFGYYILSMSENANAHTSLGFSGNLGIDFHPIILDINSLGFKVKKWKKYELKFQFGLLASYDPIRGESIILPGDGGPSFIMPSINLQVRFKQ